MGKVSDAAIANNGVSKAQISDISMRKPIFSSSNSDIPTKIPNNKNISWLKIIAIITILLILGGIIFIASHQQKKVAQNNNANNVVMSLAMKDLLDSGLLSINAKDQLVVDGQIKVNGFIMKPEQKPDKPLAGQFYYDSSTNQPYYYDGTSYQLIGGNTTVVQGQNISLNAGNGIGVSGSTIINNGIIGITGSSNQIFVDTQNGIANLSLPQSIATSSSPLFAALTLNSPLSVVSGGTGANNAISARDNLNAATRGANSDITSMSALTNINPASSLTIGSTTQTLLLQGSSTTSIGINSGGFSSNIVFDTPSSNTTITVPNLSGTVCLSVGNCSGGLGGASVSLNNLSSVAINTSLIPGSGGINLGSNSSPFNTLYIGSGTNSVALSTTTTASRSATLPDASGTICLQASAACGFALSSGGNGYIQNQNLSQQASSNFWISGIGRADTSVQTPLVDTPNVAALNIGTTNAIAVNINQNTSIANDKTLTVNGNSLFKPATDSANAFTIQTSGSQNIVKVDTTQGGSVKVLANNSGEVSDWGTTTPLPTALFGASVVTANGFLYNIGGNNGSSDLTTVSYGKIESNGAVLNWTPTTALPLARKNSAVVTSNGYIYVIGGDLINTASNTVYYAKQASDGTLGAWTATTTLPASRDRMSAIIANGYIYVMGGTTDNGVNPANTQNTVYYSKINSNGTVGAWTNTPALYLPTKVQSATTTIANGYIYIIGGATDTSAATNNVYFAKLNSNGTLNSWVTNSSSGLSALYGASTVAGNGHIYVIGGNNGSNAVNSTFAATINFDGTLGTWQLDSDVLPTLLPRYFASAATMNGYIYLLGGKDASNNPSFSTYYTSMGRVQVGGNLDLVGLQGVNLADAGDQSLGSIGGSITAGNISAVGTLQVQGNATFAQGVGINNNLSVNSDAAIAGALAITGAVTGGTYNSQTISSAANFTGTLTVASNTSIGGSLLYSSSAISLAASGPIGTAAATVNIKTSFNITTTVASLALTIPSPTTTTAGRIAYISNVGSISFTINSYTVAPGSSQSFIWNGVAWSKTDVGLESGGSINGDLAVTGNHNITGNITVSGDIVANGNSITFSNNVRGYNVPLSAAVSYIDVTFSSSYPDANYAVLCSPNYNTTCYVNNKSTTGYRLNFGTLTPGDSSGLVDWFVIR